MFSAWRPEAPLDIKKVIDYIKDGDRHLSGANRVSEPIQVSRRDVMHCISSVVGVGALSPGIVSAAIDAASDGDAGTGVLKDDRLQLMAVLVDRIVPDTDTPGASKAGVHSFINILMTDWLNPAHRDALLQGLEDLDERAGKIAGQDFLSCSETIQSDVVRRLDQEAFAVEATDALAKSYFPLLKSLTVLGYYTSEIGATEELIYDPLPGDFKGCVPYESIGRAWAIE